ncbi:enoyl-CoA hydratase/carnithine racemase [Ilumatobacter fluminis]|uniref:Enoyl-CoA hydratase/carnithine racemase n=1 Tax=Ilumatobacter fluminis TaxID=467091 RepID=A0A4R7I009_9ACTN|nr:enoyl-CoA hydratase/isomerase family protein [Ilumatobacter fluminis]TDT15866.1 enoyl-CoA hydratase/carnithine racemase [Ilumatobacter fluminis]
MSSSDLDVRTDGHVGVLEIQRGPANYFDRELLVAISQAAAALEASGYRALVLCSEDRHFCAGANFSVTATGPQRDTQATALYAEALRLFEIRLPIVAAVQGSAIGGGLGLACAADFRVASSATRLQANFARLGFHHGFGLTATLPRIVGHQMTQDLLYSGRRIDGLEGASIGLVDRVADPGAERSVAEAWAHELAASAPLALQAMRATLRGPLVAEVEQALRREQTEQARLWQTSDSQEGIAASLERRPPVFTGE